MSIAENVRAIRREIGEGVILVAATKMNDAAAVREAIAAGVDACGENRVQELVEKQAQGAYAGAPLHFIGHLQKNKVNKVVGACDLIESVDSAALFTCIRRRAQQLGIVQDVLIEVNIAREEQKGGCLPEEVPALLALAEAEAGVRVRGLMAIPPISAQPGANIPWFRQMRELFVDIGGKKYNNVSMDFLSMGMTMDYMDAIGQGANMIRVGTGIFGPRAYH